MPIAKDSTPPFTPNKYYRWYMRLCAGWDCAKDRPGDYKERHHIVPLCMGGGNEKSNLVPLSFRKHFLAHWLLTKCTEAQARVQMLGALHGMKRSTGNNSRIVSGWQFAIARLAFIKLRADPEFVAKQIASVKAMNADPEFKARRVSWLKARYADPEVKATYSTIMKTRNADPEFKAALLARTKAMHADPRFKAAASARLTMLHADPEFAARNVARMKALHANPEFAAKRDARMKARHADPEFAARHTARMKARNADPIFQAKRRAGMAHKRINNSGQEHSRARAE